jgi:hypothetical protein
MGSSSGSPYLSYNQNKRASEASQQNSVLSLFNQLMLFLNIQGNTSTKDQVSNRYQSEGLKAQRTMILQSTTKLLQNTSLTTQALLELMLKEPIQQSILTHKAASGDVAEDFESGELELAFSKTCGQLDHAGIGIARFQTTIANAIYSAMRFSVLYHLGQSYHYLSKVKKIEAYRLQDPELVEMLDELYERALLHYKLGRIASSKITTLV